MDVLKFVRTSENATAPVRGSVYAAGFDLFSSGEVTVPAFGKALIPTDIKVRIPEGCYGRIAPRSGLALKHFLDVGAGVIDRDYSGDLFVLIFNFGPTDYTVKIGQRVAQLILERILEPRLEEVDELDFTDRGASGFGSSGY